MPNNSERTGLTRRPGPARSFVHGIAVTGREVQITKEHLGVASGVMTFGGALTVLAGAPAEGSHVPFMHPVADQVGVGLMAAVVGPWLVWGGYKGARAAVREIRGVGSKIAEKGRADLELERHNRSVVE